MSPVTFSCLSAAPSAHRRAASAPRPAPRRIGARRASHRRHRARRRRIREPSRGSRPRGSRVPRAKFVPAGRGPRRARPLAYGTIRRRSSTSISAGASHAPDPAHGPRRRLDPRRQGQRQVVDEQGRGTGSPRATSSSRSNYRMGRATESARSGRGRGRALAFLQAHAASWGGDRSQIVLMGHSSGAHLAALADGGAADVARSGAKPWLGTVSLDSAALDLVEHESAAIPLLRSGLRADPARWRRCRRYSSWRVRPAPLLLVCSSRRSDHARPPAGLPPRRSPSGVGQRCSRSSSIMAKSTASWDDLRATPPPSTNS